MDIRIGVPTSGLALLLVAFFSAPEATRAEGNSLNVFESFFPLTSFFGASSTVTETEIEPLRAVWHGSAYAGVPAGLTASISLQVRGGTPPFTVIFLRNDEFFQRVTSEETHRVITLNTATDGNYSVQRLWDASHFPGSPPGSEPDLDVDDLFGIPYTNSKYAEVQLYPLPKLALSEERICRATVGGSVRVTVTAEPPVKFVYGRAGQCPEEETVQFEGYNKTLTLPITDPGHYQIVASDRFEVETPPVAVVVHDIPSAALRLRGEMRVCASEWVHLEVNLTHGTLPWNFVLRQSPPGNPERGEFLRFDNILDRLHIVRVRRSGLYTLESVRDAHCLRELHGEGPSVPVEILTPVALNLHPIVHSACEGSFVNLTGDLLGVPPFHIVVHRNGAYHRRQIIEKLPLLLEVERAGEYTVGDVTDANFCYAKGNGSAVLKRWELPKIRLNRSEVCVGGSLSIEVRGVPPFSLNYTIYAASHTPGVIELCTNESTTETLEDGSFRCVWNLAKDGECGRYVITSMQDHHGCVRHYSELNAASFQVHPMLEATLRRQLGAQHVCPGHAVPLAVEQLTNVGPKWTATLKRTVPASYDEQPVGPEDATLVLRGDDQTLISSVRKPGDYTLVSVEDSRCGVGLVRDPAVVASIVPLPAPSARLRQIDDPGDCLGSKIGLDLDGTPPWHVILARNGNPEVEFTTALSDHIEKVEKPGHYTVYSVHDANHCKANVTDAGTVRVTVKQRATASWAGQPRVAQLCDGSTATLQLKLTGVGPWDVTILKNSQLFLHKRVEESPYTFETRDPGQYQVSSVLDSQGCTASSLPEARDYVDLQRIPLPGVVAYNQTRVCAHQPLPLRFRGSPPFRMTIVSLQDPDRVIHVPPSGKGIRTLRHDLIVGGADIPPGDYRVESVRDRYNCDSKVSLSFSVFPLPKVEIRVSSAQHLAYGEGAAVFLNLVQGLPPWEGVLVDHTENHLERLHVSSPRREHVIEHQNVPAEGLKTGAGSSENSVTRHWRVDWVVDEHGCRFVHDIPPRHEQDDNTVDFVVQGATESVGSDDDKHRLSRIN